MSRSRHYADRIAPCPAYALLKGTGGPAGSILQPVLNGVRCTVESCGRALGVEYRAPDGKPKCALCIRKEAEEAAKQAAALAAQEAIA